MSLGILNNISAIYAENNLNNTQSALQKTLQQLSSGARINSGADDAAGLAIADGLKANESALTQSVQNASDGVGLLQTADGALSQVTNLLDRAVTLATEAANGTLSSNQVSSANQEYQSIVTEIGNIGSTTNFNGNTVFGNNATSFYVGDGTATGSNYYSDVVGALTSTSVGQSAPASAAATSLANPTGANYTASTATTGASATYALANANDTFAGTLSISVGGAAPSSITFASGTTIASAAAEINASSAFSAAGLTAAVGTGANANKLTISSTTVGVAPGALTFTGSALTDTQQSQALAVNTGATVTSTTGHGASISFNALQNAGTDDVVGTLSLKVGNGSTVTAQFAPGTTLAAAVTQLSNNKAFVDAGLVASGTSGVLQITGPQVPTGGTAGANDITYTGTNLTDAPATPLPGVGTDFTSASLSTLTSSGAQSILTGVNSAIANVAYQRGIIGAYSNELQAASNTAASENVNLTAAESSIRSTNYGQATSDLAKYEVLSQTGISALAQANTVQQEILKLLQ